MDPSLNNGDLYKDASATTCYGAIFGQKWLCAVWPNELSGDLVSIQWKELFPIDAVRFTWVPNGLANELFHADKD